MKKILTGAIFASLLLANSLKAEETGIFIGANMAYGAATPAGGNGNFTGFRYGVLAGFKQFYDSQIGIVGLRYYGTLDLGTKYTKGNNNPQVQTRNLYGNVDMLYNFTQDADLEYGAFAGLALGYVSHSIKQKAVGDSEPNGFDLAVNLGLRAHSFNNHSIEFYSRIGLLNQEATAAGVTAKVKQPYQIGFRYIYSF